ncbi:class I SAM-dependent methyltransferase [Hydromonas duriensis]|uniref:Methyltransferase family protein n=1 Tax=Hydromonas duriensis TaxID=1527608 RepID=A0A4R6Y7Z2_9BURK|nr:methyltransferase domain-containing protein [Hydromonas duriensis]TDR31488.1 methyltransferase family protein [Hydromonas duriensis]
MSLPKNIKNALKKGSIKLNLGSGYTHFDGFFNVDKFAEAKPDWQMDLETTPWDLPDNSVDEVNMHHVLEHVGQTVDTYMAIWQELYRVCVDGAKLSVILPHPRHDTFIGDPTHIRPITPISLSMLDRQQCEAWIENNYANTTLALYYNVDFVIENTVFDFEPIWLARYENGEITQEQLFEAERQFNNVVLQYRFIMRVRKPSNTGLKP